MPRQMPRDDVMLMPRDATYYATYVCCRSPRAMFTLSCLFAISLVACHAACPFLFCRLLIRLLDCYFDMRLLPISFYAYFATRLIAALI